MVWESSRKTPAACFSLSLARLATSSTATRDTWQRLPDRGDGLGAVAASMVTLLEEAVTHGGEVASAADLIDG